jgi:hypothetical protein
MPRAFADGSVIVFDQLELQTRDGILAEGERRWIGVMQKDSTKYPAAGGWGFGNFAGNSRTDRTVPVNGPAGQCFACHAQKADSDYVFSKPRDRH